MNDLFIGVVSHEGSRFSVNQGPSGLAAVLSRKLHDRGIHTAVSINTEDLFVGEIEPAQVRESLDAQDRVESEWATYLERPTASHSWGRRAGRMMRQALRTFRPPQAGMIRRLLNIELSHLDLLRRGIVSGAAWILILEDDAGASDVDDLADGLCGITRNKGLHPAYVNLSHSFSPKELGITHLLIRDTIHQWAGTDRREIFCARKPVTNTVCAILYSTEFASLLVRELDSLPVEPIVPIDWRLNLAIMNMESRGALRAGDCWFVEPAPISQMSMHGHP